MKVKVTKIAVRRRDQVQGREPVEVFTTFTIHFQSIDYQTGKDNI